MYTAYVLSSEDRERVLSLYPPLYPNVKAHHVTVKYGVPKDTPLPPPANLAIIGHKVGPGIQACVVRVGAEIYRPSGGIYHLTISHDDSHKPSDSNLLLADGFVEDSYHIVLRHVTPMLLR